MAEALNYDDWYLANEDELYIAFMETGSYYDTAYEEFLEARYSEYSIRQQLTNDLN